MNGGTKRLRLEVFSKRGRLICRLDRTKGLPGIMRVTDWLSDSFWVAFDNDFGALSLLVC